MVRTPQFKINQNVVSDVCCCKLIALGSWLLQEWRLQRAALFGFSAPCMCITAVRDGQALVI